MNLIVICSAFFYKKICDRAFVLPNLLPSRHGHNWLLIFLAVDNLWPSQRVINLRLPEKVTRVLRPFSVADENFGLRTPICHWHFVTVQRSQMWIWGHFDENPKFWPIFGFPDYFKATYCTLYIKEHIKKTGFRLQLIKNK